MIRIPYQQQRWTRTERGQVARFGLCAPILAADDKAQDWSALKFLRGRAGNLPVVTGAGSGRRPFQFVRALRPQAGGRGAFHRSPAFRGHHFVNSQVCEQAAKHLADLDHLSSAFRGGWSSMTNPSERCFADEQKAIAAGVKND